MDQILFNPIFFILLIVIILLLIVIMALGKVLVSIIHSTKNKWMNGKKTLPMILLFTFLGTETASARTAEQATLIPNLNDGVFYLMLTMIGFEMLIIIVLLSMIRLFTRKEEIESKPAKAKPSILESLNASVAIEKEEEILFDHMYDGIRELDNDLPPWWKYGFYLTIVFAFGYLIHYHVISTGDLQKAEYDKSLAMAKLAKEEFERNSANNVTESNALMITDKAELEKGEVIFKETCGACHGKLGEGGVGPNLVDNFWMHGGSLKDIFKSVKYGWPDKGMKSWESDLSPVQIHRVSAYIITLKGTNPPNQKEKQGELFIEKISIAADSAKTDSIVVVDSLSLATNGNR